MCIIIWSSKGLIPKDHVLKAMISHPDGWGFTVATSGRFHTYRSVDHQAFLHSWVNRPRGPVLFHARWATHGKVVNANCHPFAIRGHDLMMAHNGTIPGFGSNKKSDTRDFIEQVLVPMPEWFLQEEGIVAAIRAAIGNSKLVFLAKDGDATIINEEAGIWKGGLWYSNHSAF